MQFEMVVPDTWDFAAVVEEEAAGLLCLLFLNKYEDVLRGLIDGVEDEDEFVLKRFEGGGGGEDEVTRIICSL